MSQETAFNILQLNDGTPICLGGKIHEAMAKIASEMKPVGKDGVNEHQRYRFRRIDDFMNAVGPLMAKHDVSVSVIGIESMTDEMQSAGKDRFGNEKMKHCVGRRVTYLFQHSDGSFKIAKAEGYSQDYADKAVNQAMSFAFKYLLMQTFCVPTEDLKDGDAVTPDPTIRETPNNGKAASSNENGASVKGKGVSGKKPAGKPKVEGDRFKKLLQSIASGEKDKKGVVIDIDYAKNKFDLTPEQIKEVEAADLPF